MKTKTEYTLETNIVSILRNAQFNGNDFDTMFNKLCDRLLFTDCFDMPIHALEIRVRNYVSIASLLFAKESEFQGKGEVGKEYAALSKLSQYTFQL